jgi:uncharacterized membrane protein
MLSGIKKYTFSFVSDVYKSIAFIPSVICLMFILLALGLLQLDSSEWVRDIVGILPVVEIREINKFTEILSTLLTGVISLTIFSFSMVMIVLNQTASTYTPKVLSLIVEQRSNQVVLGVYIGTILFYIIVLIYISYEETSEISRGLLFYFSVFFAIGSIILFVNFIHNISVSIQAKNITRRIFMLTRKKMLKKERKSEDDGKEQFNIPTGFSYNSREGGYFQSYIPALVKYLKGKELVIRFEAAFGEYILNGNKLFSVNRKIDEEEIKEINAHLIFNPDEDISEHSAYGFYQLMEIAVKALSPGINNTGVALICIDYLADLFSIKADNTKDNYICDNKDNIRIIARETSVNEIFYQSFTPIREYGKNSMAVVERLLRAFQKLAAIDKERGLFKNDLLDHSRSIIFNSDKVFTAPSDREHLNSIIESLNKYPDDFFNLPKLSSNPD